MKTTAIITNSYKYPKIKFPISHGNYETWILEHNSSSISKFVRLTRSVFIVHKKNQGLSVPQKANIFLRAKYFSRDYRPLIC